MHAMNFPPLYSQWLTECIIPTFFSVKINGRLEGFFKGHGGLRQGDPLSLYFFVMRMKIRSKLLDAAYSEGIIKYHPHYDKIRLTHLRFADDLIIFSDASQF